MKLILRRRRVVAVVTILLIAFFWWLLFLREPRLAPGTSAVWYLATDPFPSPESFPYREMIRSSQYLTMRDGVRLAMDLYLPKGLPPGTRIPAIFCESRYFRGAVLRWPFSRFMQAPHLVYPELFVRNGYAFVMADARVSGPSFGHRISDFSAEEAMDNAEFVDWITSQSWSNEIVGAYGISYGGPMAELLLASRRPAVKAAAVLNGMSDLYVDVSLPGGVLYSACLREWQRRNDAMDRNELSSLLGFFAGLPVKGIRPVDSDRSGSLLRAAVREHTGNYRVFDALQAVTFRDDPFGTDTLDSLSPDTYRDRIRATGVPIYSLSGWFDLGEDPKAAIFRFAAAPNPGSRLTIGPWQHTFLQVRPGQPMRGNPFAINREILRFFDWHLKGRRGHIESEQSVHYWTIGLEKWRSANMWPPPGIHRVSYYFGPGHSLSTETPHAGENQDADSYQVDDSVGRGLYARWDWQNQEGARGWSGARPDDDKLLLYESTPLSSPTEVTGVPAAILYVDSTVSDGQFFVYIEDVDPAGRVTYVTEGLRALHRKVGSNAPPFADPLTWHSYLRRDTSVADGTAC